MKQLIYLFSAVLLLASCGARNGEDFTPAKTPDSVSYAIGIFEAYTTLEHIQGSQLEGVDHNRLFAGFKEILLNNDSTEAFSNYRQASNVIRQYMEKTNIEQTGEATPDSVNYAIGIFEAFATLEHIKGSQLEGVNHDRLLTGYEAILLNDDSIKVHSKQWASDVINQFFMVETKRKNAAFLKENRKNDSVVVLRSGLQYKVIKKGTGISPKISDTVSVLYTGTLIDGKTFDSSRGKEVKFLLAQMIPGWKEGIPLMKEGAKYIFYIPSDLAYGDSGQFAGETMIFDVELVSVSKGPEKDSD
jgi:FKBP-type peptidyl-prolyl cis-trans isomerase